MRYSRHATPYLVLLLPLLMCCAVGCLAAAVTYPCSFDSVLRKAAATSAAVVVKHLPDGPGGDSLTFAVSANKSWEPVRITVSTKDVDDVKKYCASQVGRKPDFLGADSSCSDGDWLTIEKKNILTTEVIPAAVRLHADRLLVQRLQSNLKVPEFDPNSICGRFSVPPEHRSNGVDADLVIYAAAAPGGVWALPCAAMEDGRPVVGVMNIAPAELMYVRLATRIAAHLIAHVLGFDHQKMVSRNMVVNVSAAVRERPLAVVVNSINTVMNAKEHYDCDDIYGMELQDAKGDGTQLESHWSRRNAKDELMAPIGGGGYYTALTMAMFADLGFYKVNWKMSEPMSWGKKSGCDLLKKKCSEFVPDKYPGMFCNKGDYDVRCSSDRYFNGTCSSSIIEDGLNGKWDSCPIVNVVKDKVDTKYVFGQHRDEKGKAASPKASWCIDADVTLLQGPNEEEEDKVDSISAKVMCVGGKVKLISGGIKDQVLCDGNIVLSFGLKDYGHGNVNCPKYEEVCTISANGSSLLPVIQWDGTEKVYADKYTSGPSPIPQAGTSESGREGGNTVPKASAKPDIAPPSSEATSSSSGLGVKNGGEAASIDSNPKADPARTAPKTPSEVPHDGKSTPEQKNENNNAVDGGFQSPSHPVHKLPNVPGVVVPHDKDQQMKERLEGRTSGSVDSSLNVNDMESGSGGINKNPLTLVGNDGSVSVYPFSLLVLLVMIAATAFQ